MLISRTGKGLEHLPPGARVGTSSLRRRAQLLHLRPDLEVLPLRGNIDTRIRKLTEDNLDAVVLAAAGLNRMDMAHLVSPHIWSPKSCSRPSGRCPGTGSPRRGRGTS